MNDETVIRPFHRNVYAHGKLPRIDHLSPSYALLIRDGLMARLRALPWFAHFKKFSTNKALQIQPQDVPFCGVYFIEEVGTPDGLANSGEPRFKTIARYGFSVIIQNNNPDDAERHLDIAYQAITGGILTDPTVSNWGGNRGPAKIEAFIRGSRTHQFGSVGQANEFPIAELRFDLSCDLGVLTFEPVIPDMLETMNVRTVYPWPEEPGRQEIVSEYELEENADDD